MELIVEDIVITPEEIDDLDVTVDVGAECADRGTTPGADANDDAVAAAGLLEYILPRMVTEFFLKLERAMSDSDLSWWEVFVAVAMIQIPWTLLVAAIVSRWKGNRSGGCVGSGNGEGEEIEARGPLIQKISDERTTDGGGPGGGERSVRTVQTFDTELTLEELSDSPQRPLREGSSRPASTPTAPASGVGNMGGEDDTAAASPAERAAADTRLHAKSSATKGEEEDAEPPLSEENLAPLHLHTLRVPARLHASAPNLNYDMSPLSSSGAASSGGRVGGAGGGVRSRSSSRSSARSRSQSPAPSPAATDVTGAATGTPAFDGNSSISSIDDVDPDILLDRMGFEELEPPPPHQSPSLHNSCSALPPVNERMSEDNLEDVHAFSDLAAGDRDRHPSRGGSATGGSICNESISQLLETLDEDEGEEDEDENDGGDGKDAGNKAQADKQQTVKANEKASAQQASQDILLELIGNVSVTAEEQEEVKKLTSKVGEYVGTEGSGKQGSSP